ncbi:MAG: SRPBCC domain-containing protein [Gammaproteobacteria bacterium]|nr:SRPBCC domain-containing protein [Gammaproteobacteria bacterium]
MAMKQYHTSVTINASVEVVWKHLTDFTSYPYWNPLVGKLEGEMKKGSTISTFIVPLGKTYHPILLVYKPKKEFVWLGTQGAKFLLAGKHYYRLEKISDTETKVLHGEWFTGLLSWFIPKSLLQKMENTFVEHNNILKQRIENEA